MGKRRVLVWADSPTVSTGFGMVTKNILPELKKSLDIEIDVVGINFYGDYDRAFLEKYGYINKLTPARDGMDLYGRNVLIDALTGYHKLIKPPYDVLFTIQDHFIFNQKVQGAHESLASVIAKIQSNTLKDKETAQNYFSWVGYWPIDGQIKKVWAEDVIGRCDFPVCYTEYGREQVKKFTEIENLEVIYHGTNTQDFYQLPKKLIQKKRNKYFGKLVKNVDDAFIIVNVNRNQIRKDLPRTLLAYKKLRERVPNAFLYLHCNPLDVGGNLYQLAEMIGLDSTSFAIPKQFDPNFGFPISVVNDIYNCADVLLTTTHGEGWGLSITEAMATKTLVVAPDNTVIPEILDNGNRGVLTPCLPMDQAVFYGSGDNDVPRPMVDVDKLASTLEEIYHNKPKYDKIIENGYQFATQNTWSKTNEQWVKIFTDAFSLTDKARLYDISQDK